MNRPVLRLLSLTVLWLSLGSSALGLQIWIQWDPNPEPDLAYYLVFKSALPQTPPPLRDLVARVKESNCILENLAWGSQHFIWVQAVDQQGLQSSFAGPYEICLDSVFLAASKAPDDGIFKIEHLDGEQLTGDPFIDRTLDNDDSLEFVWTDLAREEATYRLYLQENFSPEIFLDKITTTSYLLTPVSSGSAYRLRVEAVDRQGRICAQGVSQVIRCLARSDNLPVPNPPEAQLNP